MFSDTPPFPVLAHFAPHTRGLTWQRASGGFSGATVWRGDGGPCVALKAWPANVPPERLRQIHAWMSAARRLPFMPEVLHGVDRHAAFFDGARVWDCCRWLPGTPVAAPTVNEVAAACEAVARLHCAWMGFVTPQRGPCPGVRNRLRVLADAEPLLRAGPGALPPVATRLDPLLRQAVTIAARTAPGAVDALRKWEHREFLLHPCVRDLRGEHVLFSGHTVTGIVDYGAAAVDHAASDLARLLGDLAGPNAGLFVAGMNAYREVRPAFDATDDLVRLLASTGAVCSALGWLDRLVIRHEPVIDEVAIQARLTQLLTRAEQIASF